MSYNTQLEKNKKIHQVSIGISDDLKKRLINYSIDNNLSFSEIVRICCNKYLENNGVRK